MTRFNLNQLAIFLAFLPYSPNLISFTDLEPFCFLVCLILIVKNFRNIPIKHIDLVWILALSMSITASATILKTITDFRILFGGISFIVFFIYGFAILPKLNFDKMWKLVKYFWLLWILGIVLQVVGLPTEMMSPDRTTPGRGFTSFAPEATFAALHIVSITTLLIIYNRQFSNAKRTTNRFFWLGWSFPIFVHISATALGCYLGGFFARFLLFVVQRPLYFFILLAGIVSVLAFFLITRVELGGLITSLAVMFDRSSIRMLDIWEYVLTGRLMEDASAFDRLASSLFFLLSPYYFPQVINHSIWISDINSFMNWLGSANQVNYSYRNLSGLGQLNVLTGLLFLIPLRGVIKACFILPYNGKGIFVLVPAFIFSLFFSTPLAHPLFGITLGLAAFVFQKVSEKENNNVSKN